MMFKCSINIMLPNSRQHNHYDVRVTLA